MIFVRTPQTQATWGTEFVKRGLARNDIRINERGFYEIKSEETDDFEEATLRRTLTSS